MTSSEDVTLAIQLGDALGKDIELVAVLHPGTEREKVYSRLPRSNKPKVSAGWQPPSEATVQWAVLISGVAVTLGALVWGVRKALK